LVLYPLSFFSVTAFIGIGATHGMEYLGVFNNYSKNTKYAYSYKTTFALGAFVAIAGLGLINREFGILQLFGMANIIPNYIYMWITPLWFAILIFHNYIDGVIFRFKDPMVFKHFKDMLV